MFGISDYGAFVAAIVLFLALPGPGNLALITSTGQGRIRGGLAAALGLIAGDQAQLWMAVAGVAAVLHASPRVFYAAQCLGALYLVWLGVRMLWGAVRGGEGGSLVRPIKSGHYFRQSLTITLLNPKAIMFYLAFFPLFVDPHTHQGITTFGFMALTIAALSFMYGLTVVLLTHFLAERLGATPWVRRSLEATAGTFLLGFGVKLALTKAA